MEDELISRLSEIVEPHILDKLIENFDELLTSPTPIYSLAEFFENNLTGFEWNESYVRVLEIIYEQRKYNNL